MAKYKYVSNKNPADSTNQIILEVSANGDPTRVLALGGEEELTYTQYLRLKDIFVLTAVKEEKAPEPKVASLFDANPELAK